MPRGNNKIEMAGKIFGRYLVVSEAGRDGGGIVLWLCSCDCGTQKVVRGNSLRLGIVVSCGCHKNEIFRKRATRHGKTKTQEYAAWRAMKSRCNAENNEEFKNYGARGIKVCPAWNNSFETFLSDMGEKPTPRHSIERRDVNRGYSKDNCYWIPLVDQGKNTRRTHYVAYGGKRVPLLSIFYKEKRDFPYQRFQKRVVAGWDIDWALAAPLGAKRDGCKMDI